MVYTISEWCKYVGGSRVCKNCGYEKPLSGSIKRARALAKASKPGLGGKTLEKKKLAELSKKLDVQKKGKDETLKLRRERENARKRQPRT